MDQHSIILQPICDVYVSRLYKNYACYVTNSVRDLIKFSLRVFSFIGIRASFGAFVLISGLCLHCNLT